MRSAVGVDAILLDGERQVARGYPNVYIDVANATASSCPNQLTVPTYPLYQT